MLDALLCGGVVVHHEVADQVLELVLVIDENCRVFCSPIIIKNSIYRIKKTKRIGGGNGRKIRRIFKSEGCLIETQQEMFGDDIESASDAKSVICAYIEQGLIGKLTDVF